MLTLSTPRLEGALEPNSGDGRPRGGSGAGNVCNLELGSVRPAADGVGENDLVFSRPSRLPFISAGDELVGKVDENSEPTEE